MCKWSAMAGGSFLGLGVVGILGGLSSFGPLGFGMWGHCGSAASVFDFHSFGAFGGIWPAGVRHMIGGQHRFFGLVRVVFPTCFW